MSEQCAECAKKDAEIVKLRRLNQLWENTIQGTQDLNQILRERRDQAEAIVRKLTGMSVSEYERKEGEEKKKQ